VTFSGHVPALLAAVLRCLAARTPALVSMAQRLLGESGVRVVHGEIAGPRVAGPWACRPHAPRWQARVRRRSHLGKVSQAVSD
jgi:hypothetical protein